MTNRLGTVVVGLGRAGSRFDEERERAVVWSHVGAYLERADAFELVGACDPDGDARAAFRQRCPDVPLYAELDELVARARPEVASICTPVESHAAVLHSLLTVPTIETIWCEKPLAASLAEGEAMVGACAERRVSLVVSHGRRWLPLWRRFAALVHDGAIGSLVCLRVAMPNRLWTMTSHAVDLALMIGGPAGAVQSVDLPELQEDGEPARAAFLRFVNGGYGILQVTGQKTALHVEVEAIGAEGRLVARESDGIVRCERFVASTRFAGYRELVSDGEEQLGTLADVSHFLAIADEIAELAGQVDARASCGGADALAVQRILDEMAQVTPGRVDVRRSA